LLLAFVIYFSTRTPLMGTASEGQKCLYPDETMHNPHKKHASGHDIIFLKIKILKDTLNAINPYHSILIHWAESICFITNVRTEYRKRMIGVVLMTKMNGSPEKITALEWIQDYISEKVRLHPLCFPVILASWWHQESVNMCRKEPD